ncbi:MAG: polysaccharide pyruvyl transferase family protein [Pontiellaceae bacterium]
MKLGILTYHEGLNHGAYLQAFATMKVLKGLGHDVTIINYKNQEHWLQEDLRPWLAYRRPIRFLDRLKKERAFKKDHKQFHLTPFTKDPKKVQEWAFDVVVVGSDVVWNYKIFGFDPVYFGGFVADRKVSFAASSGWVNHGESHPQGMADGLSSFHAISVRDENTRAIVQAATGEDAPIVLDPTLVYDFGDDEVMTTRIRELGDYLLIYAYVSDSQMVKKIQDLATEKGLKTLSLGYRQLWCDKTLMDVGPLEWLSFYKHAACVATSTFHGTIFALKYEKEFLYIKNEKAKNRVVSLAEICGLSQIMFGDQHDIVMVNPDYTSVKKALKPLVDSSLNWLSRAINPGVIE